MQRNQASMRRNRELLNPFIPDAEDVVAEKDVVVMEGEEEQGGEEMWGGNEHGNSSLGMGQRAYVLDVLLDDLLRRYSEHLQGDSGFSSVIHK